MAPRRRREATGRRPLPRSPNLSGSQWRPRGSPSSWSRGRRLSLAPPKAAALPVCSPSAPKKARLARVGRREAAAVLAQVLWAASAAEGIPAPSLQPPPTPRFSLPPAGPLPPARPASGSGFRGGLEGCGPGCPGCGRVPAASPARQAPRLCGLRGPQRCAGGAGGDRRRGEARVRSFFHAALPAGRDKKEETGVGGAGIGMRGVWGPASQNDITS